MCRDRRGHAWRRLSSDSCPLATSQFTRACDCSTVMGASTRTASRSPEISVDEIGGHGRAVSPGGTSGAIAGRLGDRNTSHVRDIFLVARPELAALLSDCPYIERASPSGIDQVDVVTSMSLLLLIRPGLSRRQRTVRYP